jgi:hypothetical protein
LAAALSPPFDERFWFDRNAQGSVAFDDRFAGEFAASAPPVYVASFAPRAAMSRVAAAAPAPRAPARSGLAQGARKQPSQSQLRLASVSDASLPLAYAPSDPGKSSAITSSIPKNPSKASDPFADIDTAHTAVYDITSHTVYLPNGRRLEAHSGLGDHMDDPRYVHVRMAGATPPNIYDLRLRESLFHGVRAIRLIPVDDSRMHGRGGILAHTYMLGPSGQSNGCVSFSDYPAFLDAFLRGEVTRLVVVEHLADAPSPKTASDWFGTKLKDIFRRS